MGSKEQIIKLVNSENFILSELIFRSLFVIIIDTIILILFIIICRIFSFKFNLKEIIILLLIYMLIVFSTNSLRTYNLYKDYNIA